MRTEFVVAEVSRAVVQYRTEHDDRCPATIGVLVDERYLARVPVDAWGQALGFRCPGEHDRENADIVSAGPDRMFATPDDIRSWRE